MAVMVSNPSHSLRWKRSGTLHPPGKRQLIPMTANAEATDDDDDDDDDDDVAINDDDDDDDRCATGGGDDNEAITDVCLDVDTGLSLLDLAFLACSWMCS